MAEATDKRDILMIVDNFVLIHRKHIYLFQRLSNTVLGTMAAWDAPDLAALCRGWAQLGFLREDLCVAMAPRVLATAHMCSAQELCLLMDAYATARCVMPSVVEEVENRTVLLLDDFQLPELCLHASSFARLGASGGEPVLEELAARLAAAAEEARATAACLPPPEEGGCSSVESPRACARDLTLAAYAFARLGVHQPEAFSAISRCLVDVIRDLSVKDLQTVMVAFARAGHWDAELLPALSLQASRRIAQFNSESLVLVLRAAAFFQMRDSPLFTRAVVQLPRAVLAFRPVDVTILLNSFAAARVHRTLPLSLWHCSSWMNRGRLLVCV
ncbi:unnamed protein product [Prorocentrum cordatum]|uniref:RNA-editing substrate-binding complex 6 protein domain-containing protein n=1 Tax=Prorocentrum cordatum TaxID=2364126 RepID=A0ABN9PNS5_9DINO|nr:unnamed protein product [Polarella glacialis]